MRCGIMDHHHEKTSTLFTRLASGLSGKLRSAIAPPSRSPAPQTSLSMTCHTSSFDRVDLIRLVVFQLPDELILSILSHVAPDTQYTGRWVRFRLMHDKIDDDSETRARFLQRLSLTCRAMWSRLAPWFLEHLELSSRRGSRSGEPAMRKLDAIANALRADTSLTTGIKYFCTVLRSWVCANPCPLKVHDNRYYVGSVLLFSIRRMPKVPPKSTHAGDRTGEQLCYDPTQESSHRCQTSSDQDSGPTPCRLSSSPTLS